jgi:hypothetical protein
VDPTTVVPPRNSTIRLAATGVFSRGITPVTVAMTAGGASIAAVDDEIGDRVRIVVVATAEVRDVGTQKALSRIVTAPPVLAIRWTADPVGGDDAPNVISMTG